MAKAIVVYSLFLIAVLMQSTHANAVERWYSGKQIELGERVYKQYCAACHGSRAEATPNWQQRYSNGMFPAPPLNGTAHTWHHSFQVLAEQIKSGSFGGLGNMPPFRDILTNEEIVGVLAWIQNLWSDEIYEIWWEIQLNWGLENDYSVVLGSEE